MKENRLVSIIFPAKNEGINVKTTLESLFVCKTNYPFEAIVVNDGSNDGCCEFIQEDYKENQVKLIHTKGIGAANARNLGAKHAKGRFLIFCDAHLFFEDYWIDKLLQPILNGSSDVVTPGIASTENPTIVGYGQTLTNRLEVVWNTKKAGLMEIAIVPGGCFIISKDTFNAVGGFETGFKTWGHEDVELSIKLWLFGFKCHVEPNVTILHLFRTSHPYKLAVSDVKYNLLRMAYSHFKMERIQKCHRIIRSRARAIDAQVINDGILMQRETYFQKRKYDDDWYFNKFHINF